MKKTILTTILSFLIASTAYAQAVDISGINTEKPEISSTKQRIAEIKQNAQNAIKNARELASSTRISSGSETIGKREEIKTAVQELKEQKIENQINQVKENALRDFDITIRNLDNLNLRISSRLDKLEASGTIPMTESRNLLEIASTSIETVKIAVDNFRATDFLTSSSTSKTASAKTQPIKDSVKEIKDLIKDSHSNLINVINSIVKGQDSGTTTESE